MEFPITARKPEGGFVFLSVAQLCAVWCAYTHGLLHWLDVRVWCAAHELVARRCHYRPGTTPCFTQAELVPLLGHHRGIAAAVQRLTTLGFVTWQSNAIGFAVPERVRALCPELDRMLARMPHRRCDLPVPRRVLRFIAGGCRRSMFATVCGHLLTCLTYGQGQCRSGGYCTASWIATTFGISLRSVKAARRHLLAIDLLQAVPTSCLVRNRRGAKMLVNLQWTGPRLTQTPVLVTATGEADTTHEAVQVSAAVVSGAHETGHDAQPLAIMLLPTQPPCSTHLAPTARPYSTAQLIAMDHHHPAPVRKVSHESAPLLRLDVHEPAPPMDAQKLFCEEENNQKPADSGSAGRLSALVQHVHAEIKAGRLPRCEEPRIEQRTATVRAHVQPIAEPERVTPPPTLQHITRHDLREMDRLLCLYQQAVDRRWIGRAEADRLTFVALAQHVLLYRAQNPGGLLHRLLTKRLFHYVTQEDEDQALARLKAYEHAHSVGHVPDTTRSTRRA